MHSTRYLIPKNTLGTSKTVSCGRSQSALAPDSGVFKQRVTVLGCGWGGFRLAKNIDKSKYDVTVVSPRNHFLFTPLLPSTTTGTLEFRCVQEPVRTIRNVSYYQARAMDIDFENKRLTCKTAFAELRDTKFEFSLDYDVLVIAVGAKSNTFNVRGIKSVEEEASTTGTNKHNVFFLKQLHHARGIRNRIIECFERASHPLMSAEEAARLLTFVVIGGGPTSIEFTSELNDFIQNDVSRWYSDLEPKCRIIVVEAGHHLLGSFDASLSRYVERAFRRKNNISIKTSIQVTEMLENSVLLSDGSDLPFGVCVWSTGNAPMEIVKRLELPTVNGRIVVKSDLSVLSLEDVYAIGDCAICPEHTLPQLAQVANQQGRHLAKCLNHGDVKPFNYRFMGSMAQLGTWNAVAELPKAGVFSGAKVSGLFAFLMWRAAYWTYSVSITNKILIPMFWFKSYWFGRDISKF